MSKKHYLFTSITLGIIAACSALLVSLTNLATKEQIKQMAEETGIGYQTLIDFCLLDCVINKKTIKLGWESKEKK